MVACGLMARLSHTHLFHAQTMCFFMCFFVLKMPSSRGGGNKKSSICVLTAPMQKDVNWNVATKFHERSCCKVCVAQQGLRWFPVVDYISVVRHDVAHMSKVIAWYIVPSHPFVANYRTSPGGCSAGLRSRVLHASASVCVLFPLLGCSLLTLAWALSLGGAVEWWDKGADGGSGDGVEVVIRLFRSLLAWLKVTLRQTERPGLVLFSISSSTLKPLHFFPSPLPPLIFQSVSPSPGVLCRSRQVHRGSHGEAEGLIQSNLLAC